MTTVKSGLQMLPLSPIYIMVPISIIILFMNVMGSVRCLEFISSHYGCLAKMALIGTDIHVIFLFSLVIWLTQFNNYCMNMDVI